MKSNIAILFFSRSINGEAKHKYWDNHLPISQRLELSSVLIKQTLKTLSHTGIDVFHYDESLQRGNTFGEKIANAQDDIFQKGYKGIITVGNDCIELDKVNWVNLVDSISNGVTCIGPNYRNGTYLIGTPVEQFDKEAFARLDWHGESLLSELIALQSHVELLSQLSDFNDVYDLDHLIDQRRISIKLANILVKIFSSTWIQSIALQPSWVKDRSIFRFKSLRAPPAA
jgi:hypothetical protein